MTRGAGQVYLLRAGHTGRFKVGFTSRPISARAAEIDGNSPTLVFIVGARPGDRSDERALHQQFRQFRVHGEWFDFPEEVLWPLLRWFGERGWSVLHEGAACPA